MPQLKKPISALLAVLFCVAYCIGQTQPKPINTTQLSYTNKGVKLIKTQGSDEYQEVGCSLLDRAGNLWFGTSKEGVYKYDGTTFTQFTVKDGLSSNGIVSMFEDKAGNFWLGSKFTISRYDGKKFTTIPIPSYGGINFMASNAISSAATERNELWCMMQDRKGMIWLGTTNGIYCYDGKTFTRFLDNKSILNTSKVGLKWTQCMFEDKAGNIWFGSWVLANEGLCRYDGKSITQYKPYGEGWVRSVLEDKNGDVLIVTRHNGVCRFDGVNFTNFTKSGGLQNASINTAFKDKAGNLWFGTELGSGELNEDGGLWYYDGKVFTRYTRKDGLCHNGVYSIVEDTAGNIWLGTRNTDLCRFNGKTFTSFSE